jgi:hypothetical protein
MPQCGLAPGAGINKEMKEEENSTRKQKEVIDKGILQCHVVRAAPVMAICVRSPSLE